MIGLLLDGSYGFSGPVTGILTAYTADEIEKDVPIDIFEQRPLSPFDEDGQCHPE